MENGGADWYTRTSPRFEVDVGNEKYGWLAKSLFLGNLKPPQRPGYVEIDVYEVLYGYRICDFLARNTVPRSFVPGAHLSSRLGLNLDITLDNINLQLVSPSP
jgi:hypothetical protein